ncbi:MAG: AAA family ATPase [Verrucomicrobia bacterium]|nr:AAA family ATPase [Verrucomicrobiota bacterium]
MLQAQHESSFLFPVGVSDFRKLITGNFIYVDKTLGIKHVLQESEISIICRPRRFGKTLFMSMLQHFFADAVDAIPTKTLFHNSLLARQEPKIVEQHQGKYCVIFLTFKDLKSTNFDSAYQGIKQLLWQLYEEHIAVLDSHLLSETEKEQFRRILTKTQDFEETRTALKDLSHFIFKAYQKRVVVLIDEYDTPILSGYLENYYKDIIRFMKGFLGAGLKDNPYVIKTVLTGIIRVAKENLFSDLNNAEVYSVLRDSYSDDFGFTESEVNQLLQKTDLSHQAEDIKKWYNGYKIGTQTIYNPWSIISCLKHKGKFEPYWVNTSANELIRKILAEASAEAKIQLETLMQGGEIICPVDEHITFEDLSEDDTALWSLLLFSGYLTAQNVQLDALSYYQCDLSIPNQEVLSLYRKQLVSSLRDRIGVKRYDAFINHLLTGNLEAFQELLNHILLQTISYFDTQGNQPERFYHGFILGLIATLHDSYHIYSNRESGLGRYDIALIPLDASRLGLVLEFKTIADPKDLETGAKEALKQTKTKLYATELLSAGIKKVLQIGMAFCGKKVAIASQQVEKSL